MITFIGLLIALAGFGAALAQFTGMAGSAAPMLDKMPLGIVGWLIVGGVGVLAIVLNRRPAD